MSEAGGAATAASRRPPARIAPLLGAFVLDLALAAAILLATMLAGGFALGLWRLLLPERAPAGPAPDLLAQMLMIIVASATVAVVLCALRQPAAADERARSLAALRRRSTWGWTLLTGAAVFAGSAALGWLMRQLGVEPVPTNEAMVAEASARWPVFLALFVVVLAPLYEELLFRRVLFGRFLRAGRPWLGLLLSSVAFAVAHEVPLLSANPPLAVLMLWIAYGGLGAAFAWVYWRTGTLWAAVLAHALNNGIALAFHGA